MDAQRNFKAFISYRHCPLDMVVAEETQELIERYRIPKEYRKDGKKELGLVFRDVSELPLCSNLSDDIYEALDHSEFLIVICTPETPKSLWVQQEINYFIRTHGRERILIVLAAGTPEESLPEILTHVYDENGNLLRQIEPLCANLVAQDQKTVLKKLKKEFLRLVAAMLRVPYDALYQRRKRYLFQLAAAGIGVFAAVLILIVGLLISWNLDVTQKNEEIASNFRLAQEKESEALSLLSQQYLASGERISALESALQALPKEGEDRPYLADAEGALAKALNPYGNGMLNYHLTLEHPTTVHMLALSRDGTRLATADTNDSIRCYDTVSGKLLWQYHADSFLSGSGNTQMQIVGEDKILLVRSYATLYALSMESGSLLHTMDLQFEKSTYTDTAELAVSQQKDRFTLRYESGDGTCEYRVYKADTFALIHTVTDSDDKDYFFESLPDQQEERYITAVFSDTDDSLTVTVTDEQNRKIYDCVMGSVKPKDNPMDATLFHPVFLPDGSLVIVCYLEDTDYSLDPNRRFVSLHKISPDGAEVYRQQFDRPVYFRHLAVGDYLVFLTDTYNGTQEFTTFGSVMTLLDMSADFSAAELDFGNTGVHDCYIRADGELVTVMTDGSILTPLKEEYGLVYTELPNYNQWVRDAAGAQAGEELICLIPENTPDRVVMLHSARNPDAVAIEDSGSVILFPSGKRFLTVQYHSEDHDGQPLVTIYDAQSLEQLDRFALETQTKYPTLMGFSADETQLLFDDENGYAYNLTNHTWTKFTDLAEISSEHWETVYSQPQAFQLPGKPLLSVVATVDAEKQSICWYEDTEPVDSYTYPCREGESIPGDWVNWNVGANGLIVCSAFPDEGPTTPSETFVYSTQDRRCHRVSNASAADGVGIIGVGTVSKVVAFADTDGMVRIYDFDRDAVVNSFPIPVSPNEVSALKFVGMDQYLLVFKRNGSVATMDLADGTVLAELLLDNPVYTDSNYIQEDPDDQHLYIHTDSGRSKGYQIDMQTWTVTAEIPGLAAFLPQTEQLLQWEYYSNTLLVSPVYICEELIAQAQELLDMAAKE